MYRYVDRQNKPHNESIKHATRGSHFFFRRGIISSRLRCNGLLTSYEVNVTRLEEQSSKGGMRLVKEKLPSHHKGLCQVFEV